jgi:hypothetical protein
LGPWMTYTPPVAEQRFLIDHIVRMEELASGSGFSERRRTSSTPSWRAPGPSPRASSRP